MKRKQALSKTKYKSNTESSQELRERQNRLEENASKGFMYCTLHERPLTVQEIRKKHCYINFREPYLNCKYCIKGQR